MRAPRKRGRRILGPPPLELALALLSGAALILAAAGTAGAQSPLVQELRAFSTRYHEDPAHLDALRDGLERAVKADPRPQNLVALAEVCFLWGDVRATTSGQRLEAYDRGRDAAKHALEVDPKNALAHFWYATNSGRWAQTKGVIRSLFLLPSIKEEIRTVLDLDPGFAGVYALAGNVYYEVPGLFGGDLEMAEAMFRKGLALDPKFTGMRVGLGKTLVRRGRIAEARRQLQAVLDEEDPSNPADWTVKDSREARQLLESIKDRS
ncbi:MAG TPA: tetratricopeptide repeat protein [Candidatus Methylomirabilis sp.]